MFIPTISISKSKTYVLMEISMLVYCTIHKEGWMDYRNALERDKH